MRLSKCKECDLHIYETLADGGKEHYCYPPIMLGIIAFSVPCKKRSSKCCKNILKEAKKMGSGFGNTSKKKREREEIVRELQENGFQLVERKFIDFCCGRKNFTDTYKNDTGRIIQVDKKDTKVKSVEKHLWFLHGELETGIITIYNLEKTLMTDDFIVWVNDNGEIKEFYISSDKMALVEL